MCAKRLHAISVRWPPARSSLREAPAKAWRCPAFVRLRRCIVRINVLLAMSKQTRRQARGSLTLEQQQQVTGVALDIWKAYRHAVEKKLPQADIAHDRFHISQHLNEAADKVRRQENKALKEAGDRRLAGWLMAESGAYEKNEYPVACMQAINLKNRVKSRPAPRARHKTRR